jgi:hypothetical protein
MSRTPCGLCGDEARYEGCNCGICGTSYCSNCEYNGVLKKKTDCPTYTFDPAKRHGNTDAFLKWMFENKKLAADQKVLEEEFILVIIFRDKKKCAQCKTVCHDTYRPKDWFSCKCPACYCQLCGEVEKAAFTGRVPKRIPRPRKDDEAVA